MRLLLVLLSLVPSIALAQTFDFSSFNFNQLTDARGYAMGGAYRVLGQSADATNGNPASLTALKTYQVELSGGWDPTKHNGLGSLVFRDSTNDVAAGTSYHLLSVKDASGAGHFAHVFSLALGIPITELVSIGVSGKYVKMSDANISAATVDAGLELQPVKGLFLGIAGHNLVNTNHPELAKFYSAGIGYTASVFSAEFDVTGDPWREGSFKPTYSVGGEGVLGGQMALRAGFQSDTQSGAKFVSGGLGFFGEGGTLDLAYRRRTDAPGDVLMLSLRLSM